LSLSSTQPEIALFIFVSLWFNQAAALSFCFQAPVTDTLSYLLIYLLARAGSGVVRIDPLCFLARCRKMRLNQALSVLSLSQVSFDVCVLCCYLGTLFRLCYFCVICVFCCLVRVRLSVPVQVIDWKDSSPK